MNPKNSAYALAALSMLGAIAYYALGGQPGPGAPPVPVVTATDLVDAGGVMLGTHVTMDYADAGLPAGATKAFYSLHGQPEDYALVKMTAGQGGYGFAAVCAVEVAEGVSVAGTPLTGSSVPLPKGMTVIPGTEGAGGPCQPGDHVMELWAAGHPGVPFECACGPGCLQLLPDGTTTTWEAGGKNTLRAGQWKAADPATCYRRPCVELEAGAADPPGCR